MALQICGDQVIATFVLAKKNRPGGGGRKDGRWIIIIVIYLNLIIVFIRLMGCVVSSIGF